MIEVIIDVRADEFKSVEELCKILDGYKNEAEAKFGDTTPVEIVMHYDQHKYLRLERIVEGQMEASKAKTTWLETVNSIPVRVVDNYDDLRCQGCGKVH